MFTGKIVSREIDVTPEQIAAWQNGMLIQNAMPDLSASDREFIMTGLSDEEWEEATFTEDDDNNGCIEDGH